MFKSIRQRIGIVFVLLVLIAEALAGVFVTLSTTYDYHTTFEKTLNKVFSDDMRKTLTDTANTVTTQVIGEGTSGAVTVESTAYNSDSILNIIKDTDLYRDYSQLRIAILDGNGEVKYSEIDTDELNDSQIAKSAVKGNEGLKNKMLGKEIEYAIPLMNGESVSYVIYMHDPMTNQMRLLSRMIAIFIILMPIIAMIAYLFSLIFAQSVTAPLKALADNAKKLADGDDSALSQAQGKDEIAELTNALIYLSQSKREHSEKATAEKTKLEAILLNMKDGIMAFGTDGKLTHINPEAQRLLNRKFVDDIVFNKFFKEINADITLESLQYMPTDEGVERQVTIGKHVLQLSFAPVNETSGDGGYIVIIHDVTKQEKLEQSRREFVANVSHELRTPITVIKSYSDILADSPDAEPETRTRFLDTISSETDRMAKIISDLLTLSSLDEKTNYTRPAEEIDVRNMIENLVDRLAPQAKKREQTLIYTPINDVPKIRGDRGALDRVFTNIISNALKYTPSGGKIEIFTSKVYNDIMIKVSDTGIGISKEQLPNIFDRFYRVDKARSRDRGGTGLGLAIAKQTIESTFHGKILISSELNKGTDVTVTIPIKRK